MNLDVSIGNEVTLAAGGTAGFRAEVAADGGSVTNPGAVIGYVWQ